MTAGRGYASSVVREDFLEEEALQLDQGRRERRHILGREWPGQVRKAGACPVCGDVVHGSGQAGARDGGGVRAESGGAEDQAVPCADLAGTWRGNPESGVKARDSPRRSSPGAQHIALQRT